MKYFFDGFFALYQQGIFIYCCALYTVYFVLSLFSYLAILANKAKTTMRGNTLLIKSSLTPGISIVTGAFNEELNIISNVRSLLTMNYSLFEVIVVNDGSSDTTLEKLISEFGLVEVPFAYNYFVECKTVLRIMKSENPAFANLIIVDKINGGSKADAINAGINVASYDYFLNTDVDCILDKETLAKLIQPFIDDDKRVIASGAAIRMVNSCIVDSSVIVEAKVPRKLLPRFQEIEYIRSFALGKMGWNLINCISNVSGGLGMFDKDIVIKAGGYDPRSFGEDMDMLIRMSKYMHDTKQKYAVRYIPQTLCWTEGPTSLTVFKRQRVRWARGLYQIFSLHAKLLFNPKYGKLGLIVLPYNFLFELFAPLIELLGIICYVYLIINNMLNWPNAIALLVFVYTFSILITLLAIVWDQLIMKSYRLREVLKLCFWALLEPFIYHPLVMVFAVTGYIKQFFRFKADWGCMERKGFARVHEPNTTLNNTTGI